MSASQPRCATCGLAFDSMEAMRKHFETEFHVNNVRLRVEGTKTLTKAEFSQQNDMEDDADTPTFYCKLCKKTFRSVQTLQSHVKSTTHLLNKEARIIARDSDAASMLSSTSLGSAAIGLHRRHRTHHSNTAHTPKGPRVTVGDREEDCSALRCLLCGHLSSDFNSSLKHLLSIHHFTIPLEDHCKDKEGLIEYLSRKVNGLVCLTCNEKSKGFESLEALRHHMTASNHDCITLSPELQDFYTIELTDDTYKAPKTDKQLHLNDGSTVFKKDCTSIGLQNRHCETEKQQIKRKVITASNNEALQLMKQERYEIMKPQLKAEAKRLRREGFLREKHALHVAVRANKLHMKGYEGDGVN